MRSSPELRPRPLDGLVVLAVVFLAAACALLIWNRGTDGGELTAVVTVDSTEVLRVPLRSFPDGEQIYTGNGYTLHVYKTADPGLCVEEADCPTQDCVRTGRITRAGQSIVCLPARIIIRLDGGTMDRNAPDMVIG